MPRTNVPVTDITRAGVNVGAAGTEVNADTANNHEFVSGDGVFLGVRNSDAALAHNVTLVIAAQVDGQVVTNPVISIPANGHKNFGNFPGSAYQQADGRVYINVDHATLRLQAFKAPR